MSDLKRELREAIEGSIWGSGWNDHRSFVELNFEAAVVLLRLLGAEYVELKAPPDKIEQFKRLWNEEVAKGSAQPIVSGGPDLDASFGLAKQMVEGNAFHAKRGIHLLEQGPQDVLNHLKEEIAELEEAPNDLDEMGDILNLCANYSARKGWTPAMLAAAMERKMRLRLTLEEKPA